MNATDKNTMKLFVFDSVLKESKIELSPITRCVQTQNTYNYNQIFTLSDDYICFFSNDTFEIMKVNDNEINQWNFSNHKID